MYVSRIMWFINRLTAMSPLEVGFRIYIKLRNTFHRRKQRKHRLIIEKNLFNYTIERFVFCPERLYIKLDEDFRKILLKNYPGECSEVLEYAEHIVSKKFALFNQFNVDFSEGMDWHTAFNGQKKWPLIYSPSIDFRHSVDLNDIRFNWELNRHHFLTTLAAAFFISKDYKYLSSLKEYFYNWVENNPFMYGVNWISSMEAAIRALSWMCCLAAVEDGSLKADLETGIKNQIHYVFNNYSRYSSANNHIIVESAAVGMAGILFDNESWLKSGIENINKEIEKQVSGDGVNREQSIHYQAFAMEAVSLFLLLLKKNNMEYPHGIDKRLEGMNDFLSCILNINGEPPDIGDNDQGRIINIKGQDKESDYYKYVLYLGSLMCGKKGRPNGLTTFKEGGYSIFRYGNTDKENLLIFDHGFLGYKSLCAHGHADALSITLCVDGEYFLIDPGTYIYNIERHWRDYFRKTVNHNTVEINGKDQSEIKGTFLWGRKAKTVLLGTDSSQGSLWALAEHYGYSPVVHQRKVEFFQPDVYIIEDTVKGKCNELVQSFILGKGVEAEQISEKQVIIRSKLNRINIVCKGAGSFVLEKVYISPHFGEKQTGTALRRRICSIENETFQTIILIDRDFYSEAGEELNEE